MADCLDGHGTKCSEQEAAVLPKRVIEIDRVLEDGSLSSRLVTTNGGRGRYLALSYCWGRGPFFNLTTDNIQDLHKSLPVGMLPQTIYDAMLLTSHLGFRYLWVDSLCIIQGSDTTSTVDWEEQSQVMGRVYRSASLTIAAAAAKGCRDGLFLARSDPMIPYCPVLKRQESDEIVYLGADLPDVREQIEPLSLRGWALQEAVLSRRLLNFGTTEISWQCSCCSCRETVLRTLPKQAASTSVLSTPSEIHASWTMLVEEYSHRDLTFATDKLPAISGLAAVVSEALGHEFHFGIWQHRAHHMLLWRHKRRIGGERLVSSKQKTLPAPTWSWMSVHGGVKFLKGAVEPARLEIRGRSLIITGGLTKINSIRYQAEGSYYGEFEQHRPWMRFKTTTKTFVDDLNNIPEANRKSTVSGPEEFVDLWFFFLGKSEGLILVSAEPATKKISKIGRNRIRRLLSLISSKAHSVGRYWRVGAFIGYNEPRIKQDRLETIEII